MNKNVFCIPKKILFSLLVLIILFSSLLIVNSSTDFGGHQADPGEWPFMVALYSKNRVKKKLKPFSNFISIKDAFFCGGFFIGNEWIVTAAHCLKNSELQASNKDKESIGVAINSYNLNNIKILDTRNVVEMIEHEGFDYANKYKDWLNTSDLKLRNKSDDIALLRINLLDKELPKNTLSLNNNSQLINPGNKVIMLGWGDLGLTWLTK